MLILPTNNRRARLALWSQRRRRQRVRAARPSLLPAPVLRPEYPSKLAWNWTLANPYKWNVWMSSNGGASWMLVDDYWTYGAGRVFAPDGGYELYYIVGVDTAGNEITEHSNLVRPDDAPLPDFIGFPDDGASNDDYEMFGNGLLLHFNGDLNDTSGNGNDVTPYNGGIWTAGHYGDVDDIAFVPFLGNASGVNFNWAGGSVNFTPDWAGDDGTTVIFWVKISYSPTSADDGFNQPIICWCHSEWNTGLILQGGVPFVSSPARDPYWVTMNLSHGTAYGICEFSLRKYSWQQVAIVSLGADHQVYVNGILMDENATENFDTNSALRFGGWYDDNQMSLSPAVELAEFAVFNRAMSAEEIAAINLIQSTL